jgi:hypothetical protein
MQRCMSGELGCRGSWSQSSCLQGSAAPAAWPSVRPRGVSGLQGYDAGMRARGWSTRALVCEGSMSEALATEAAT